jgi:hypothetical protein
MDMTKSNVQSAINNNVCDGYGCYSRAISKLSVKVGAKRTISLSLCETCKTKVSDGGTTNVMKRSKRRLQNHLLGLLITENITIKLIIS